MEQTHTLVVGASLSGLAVAASLQRQNIAYTIIEKEAQAAMPWRKHYERLHLHTPKGLSQLPYKKFGNAIPRYPSREQVVAYADAYQNEFGIHPLFYTEATSITREGAYWITKTTRGVFQSKYVVLATGAYGKPKPVHFNGMETFPGTIVHSCDYTTGKKFKGQHVLVVGFGNSACEIAIDLYEQGAIPAMAVRSPVNVVPRDLLGLPILRVSFFMSQLPPRLADAINTPLMRLLFGDITKLGLKQRPYGTFQQIQKDRTIPLLDIGTISHIRKGHIKIVPGIEHIEGTTVYFTDGRKAAFDSIVAAIGYCRDGAEMVAVDKSRFDDLNVSAGKQLYFGKDGLYFCGFWISPRGQIREIALDARKIAGHIATKEAVVKPKA